MTFIKVMKSLSLRFTSGNNVPIESARITREEWDVIQNTFEEMIAREEKLRMDIVKDEGVAALTWQYIDRMADTTPEDSAEKILAEFVDDWHKIVLEE